MKLNLHKTSSKVFMILLMALSFHTVNAQTLLAGWDFQTTSNGGTAAAAAPSTPTVFVANFGSGNIYLNGTNGASTWVTATSGNELTSFGGTAVNTAGTSFSTTTSGTSAIALLGGLGGTAANGKFMVLKFTMTGYKDLVVSYASQRTSSGFSSQIWEYSTNGTTWLPAQTVTTVGTSYSAITLTTITGLDNATTAYLRFSGTGASTATGNNRLDNIQLRATAAPTTPAVTTNAANTITATSAVLNGTINANNLSTATSFDYGLDTSYGSSVVGDPTPLSNSVATAVTGAASGLAPNTLYHFRAVGTVSGTPTNGGDLSFYTLANLPNAPVVNNATVNSLDITINSTSQNSNSGITLYTIQETGSGDFVQADGSLGATPVQLTAADWGTITVTGLVSNTGYSFHLQAFNGAGVSTGYGASATLMTLQNFEANIVLINPLSDFGDVCTNASSTQSFTFNGNNLDGTNIVIGPLSGYRFSTSQNGTYDNTLTISYVGTSLTNEIVWVEFSPSAVQSYNGNITVNGGGLDPAFNVAALGSGINTEITATTGGAGSTTSVSSVLSGTIDEGCTPVGTYGIEYSTLNGFADGSGISQTGIDLSGSAFTVTVTGLEPNTTYYYKAFATDSNVTDYGLQQSFTTLNIDAPDATDATDITQNSFTANWDAAQGALSYRLDVSTSPLFSVTTPVSNLIISEYGEGSGGSKKYIEIYNGTGVAVSLANYQLWKNANGSNWNFNSDNTTPSLPLSLSGTLANGGTYVIANNSTDVIGADLYNSFIQFNGDDATGLAWNGGSGSTFSLIDVVGTAGTDPGSGWAVAGTANATVDKILIRKPTIFSPNSNWTASAGTNTTNSEWTVSAFTYSATNQTTNLGAHTINNTSPLYVSGYEDLTVNGLSQPVSGLTENTNYYYRVRAVSANSTSANSNVITVLTAPAAPTFGSITQIVGVVCEDTAATFNVTGLLPNSTSTISYDINGGPTQTVTDVVANASGFASFEIVLSLANDGQTLTVTSVERTDLAGGTLTVTSGNTALLSVSANSTWYVDADGDGYGNPTGPTVTDCSQPSGYSANNTDCNDAIAAINPGHAEVLYNGVDDNCNNQLDEGFQITTSLLPSVCNTTLASIGSLIGITTVSSAITGYRIRVTNGTTVQVIERNVPHFTLPNLPIYDYATTYTVEIMLQRYGVWLGYYGPSCTISSPAVLAENGATQVNPSQCGITLPRINTLIATTSLAGVTGYRFKITNITPGASGPNVIQTIDRTNHWFSLQMLTQYNYGSTYRVEVAIKTTGAYSGYGSPCEVSSPAAPQLINCGAVIASASSLVAATSLSGVTQYRFQIVRQSDSASSTIDRNINYFTFNMVPGYSPGVAYDVRVAVMTSGTWSPFGDACTITSPGTAARFTAQEVTPVSASFKATAYPNPFASSFAINMTTSAQENVQVMVYDMTGRLIETRDVKSSDINALQVGDRLPTGVYNVIVTQGENVETLRVIKR